MKTIFTAFIFFILTTACSNATNHTCEGKQIWGNIEKVVLVDKNITLDAKLDTGATMSSLSAKNIEVYKEKNITWVKFIVYLSNKTVTFSKPLIGTTRILKRNEELDNNNNTSQRFVIKIPIRIGHQQQNVLVNLVDRTHFRYPMLLGKDALQQFNVLVDVGQNYLVN